MSHGHHRHVLRGICRVWRSLSNMTVSWEKWLGNPPSKPDSVYMYIAVYFIKVGKGKKRNKKGKDKGFGIKRAIFEMWVVGIYQKSTVDIPNGALSWLYVLWISIVSTGYILILNSIRSLVSKCTYSPAEFCLYRHNTTHNTDCKWRPISPSWIFIITL